MQQTADSRPTNRSALISIVAAFGAILCFCGGAIPVPLTALFCFPGSAAFGLIAVIAGILGLQETRTRRERGHNLALTGLALGGAVILATLCMTMIGLALIRVLMDAFRHWAPSARM